MRKTVCPLATRGMILAVAVVALLPWLGCATGVMTDTMTSNTPNSTGNEATASFSQQVIPIFTVQCSGCHSPGGIADLAGIPSHLTADVAFASLVNKASVQNSELTLVVPGDAAASLLFLKISQDNPPVGLRMPRFAPPLSSVEINLIRDWINQGALNN